MQRGLNGKDNSFDGSPGRGAKRYGSNGLSKTRHSSACSFIWTKNRFALLKGTGPYCPAHKVAESCPRRMHQECGRRKVACKMTVKLDDTDGGLFIHRCLSPYPFSRHCHSHSRL